MSISDMMGLIVGLIDRLGLTSVLTTATTVAMVLAGVGALIRLFGGGSR